MAKGNGAQGAYYHLEARLGENDWTGAGRATLRALCEQASEMNNGTGAFRYNLADIADDIAKFDFDNKRPREAKVSAALEFLQEREVLQLFAGRYVFVKDYWSYGHNPRNGNHWPPALRALQLVPPPVREAFHRLYGNPDSYGDSIPDSNPDSYGDQEEQEEEEEQKKQELGVIQGGRAPSSANAKRELTEQEQRLVPGVQHCAKLIAVARKDAGLRPVEQAEREAAITMRQIVEHERIPAREQIALCKWMFEGPEAAFYLRNMSVIHRWRKRWKEGIAIATAYDAWKTADGTSPETREQREEREYLARQRRTPVQTMSPGKAA